MGTAKKISKNRPMKIAVDFKKKFSNIILLATLTFAIKVANNGWN